MHKCWTRPPPALGARSPPRARLHHVGAHFISCVFFLTPSLAARICLKLRLRCSPFKRDMVRIRRLALSYLESFRKPQNVWQKKTTEGRRENGIFYIQRSFTSAAERIDTIIYFLPLLKNLAKTWINFFNNFFLIPPVFIKLKTNPFFCVLSSFFIHSLFKIQLNLHAVQKQKHIITYTIINCKTLAYPCRF